MASARRPASGHYLVSRLQEELDWAIARADEMAGEDHPAGEPAPPLDVVENDSAVVLVLEVPGLAAADLEVETAGNRITVRGRRPPPAASGEPRRYHCMERGRGDFQRAVELVGALDTHAARARLNRGLLRIEIPKIADRRLTRRRIEIEAGEP